MLRNGSGLRVFTWAKIVHKPALRLFDYSIRHIDPTAKYDGLSRRFFWFFNFLVVFNFLVFDFFLFCFLVFILFSFFVVSFFVVSFFCSFN